MPKYQVFSDLYFPVFGLNPKIFSGNLRVQSGYGKIWIRENSVFRHFSHSSTFMSAFFFIFKHKFHTSYFQIIWNLVVVSNPSVYVFSGMQRSMTYLQNNLERFFRMYDPIYFLDFQFFSMSSSILYFLPELLFVQGIFLIVWIIICLSIFPNIH